MARKDNTPCALDMTPMIDVVFQLIIFFIVTIKMDESLNADIKLADAKNGPVIEKIPPSTMVVEVDRRGSISIRGARVPRDTFRNIMRNRYNKIGSFPVLIRGDYRTRHKDIKEVMDICTASGLWRIQFAGIKEKNVDK